MKPIIYAIFALLYSVANALKHHIQSTNHNKSRIYHNNSRYCSIHDLNYGFYCDDCQIPICEKCKTSHPNHILKVFEHKIPNEEEQKFQKKEIDENIGKLSSRLNNLENNKEIEENKDEKIRKRYVQVRNYLNILKFEMKNF